MHLVNVGNTIGTTFVALFKRLVYMYCASACSFNKYSHIIHKIGICILVILLESSTAALFHVVCVRVSRVLSPQKMLHSLLTLPPDDQVNIYYMLQESLNKRGLLPS